MSEFILDTVCVLPDCFIFLRCRTFQAMKAQELKTKNDFRLYLQETLVERCKTNSSYSLRAFAKQLKIEASFLSKLLAGKRRITPKMIGKLSPGLGLGPLETQKFITHHSGKSELKGATKDFKDLTVDTFRMIADWYHYAILELTQVEGFDSSPEWIARRLGLKKIEAQTAIERLLRLEMLERDEKGRLCNSSGEHTTTGNAFTAVAFRKLQTQILQQALSALENVPIELRDQSSMTMAIDSSRLPQAKEKIKKFRRELCTFLQPAHHKKTEVYQMSVSLFPVTQIKNQKTEK